MINKIIQDIITALQTPDIYQIHGEEYNGINGYCALGCIEHLTVYDAYSHVLHRPFCDVLVLLNDKWHFTFPEIVKELEAGRVFPEMTTMDESRYFQYLRQHLIHP